MNSRPTVSILLLLLLSLFGFSPALGQLVGLNTPLVARTATDTAAAKGPDTVRYKADTLEYDAQERELFLLGNARLEYRGTTLNADTIFYNQGTGILEAFGHPDVLDPTIAPFKGRALRFHLKTRKGVILDGVSTSDGGDFYRGKEIRRLPDKSLQVLDADFCQCRGVNQPDYYFSSARMTVDPDKLAVAAPVVLNIQDVPVLVAPFVLFPLGKERRSGLLTPKFGGDQKQGFYVRNLGAYWGISDYADFTAVTDLIEGESGRFDQASATATLQYKVRYRLDGNVSWKTYLQQLGSQGSKWELNYAHSQQLLPEPDRFTLKGTGSFVSDRIVRSQNALTGEEVLNQTANANLYLQYKFGTSTNLLLGFDQSSNLRTGLQTRELPSLSLSTNGQIFPSLDPLDDSWWRNFGYTYNLHASRYEDRKADNDTSRPVSTLEYRGAQQNLSVSTNKKILEYLNLTASANFRHDATWNSYDSVARPGVWRSFDTHRFDPDQILTWNTGVSANTNIYGVWLPYWGRFAGLRHTLSPSVGYTFFPHIDPQAYFVANPRLSPVNGQARGQVVSLGLGQKLDAKLLPVPGADSTARSHKGTPLSLLSLSTSTGYEFERKVRPWSDITTSFNTGLMQAINLSGNTVHTLYNVWSGDSLSEGPPILKSWGVSFGKSVGVAGSLSDGFRPVKDTGEFQPWSFGVNYSYSLSATRISTTSFQSVRSQTANLSASVKPTRSWTATWQSSYNFDVGQFVAHQLTFARPIGCWDMNFGWTPAGPAKGWTFLIQIRDLPDVKIQAASTSLRRVINNRTTP